MGIITESHLAVAIVTTVTANVGGQTNMPVNSVTLMHGHWKAKLI